MESRLTALERRIRLLSAALVFVGLLSLASWVPRVRTALAASNPPPTPKSPPASAGPVGPMVVRGVIGGGYSAEGIQTEATDAGISMLTTQFPPNRRQESYVAYKAMNVDGEPRKTASVSAKWTAPEARYAVLRLNATHDGGMQDDVAMRLFGAHGITVFGPDDYTAPGPRVIRVYGTVVADSFVLAH